jgi:hypothetical protein
MSEASQLAQLSQAPPGNRRSQSVQPAEERRREMYAVWKSVFDKIHSVALPHERPAAQESVESSRRLEGASVQLVGSVERRLQAQGAMGVSASTDPVAASTNFAAPGVAPATTVAQPKLSSAPPIVSIAAAQPTASGVVQVVSDLAGEQHSHAPASRPSATFETPTAAVSPETVHVFISGTAVRVIVRDRRIAEDDALHAGFAIAGALVGQRAALEHLVLNGQVLYRNDANDLPGAAAALMFV